MAEKSGTKKTTVAKRGSGKRELIAPNDDKRYVRRNGNGEFTESDDQSRSLAQDVRKRAKTEVTSGHGDEGDRPRASRPAGSKKKSS